MAKDGIRKIKNMRRINDKQTTDKYITVVRELKPNGLVPPTFSTKQSVSF